MLKSQNSEFSCQLDYVFDNNKSQENIFQISAVETINKVLAGYNGTIFTYGQGNSGKTYTMFGGIEEDTKGIVPRTM